VEIKINQEGVIIDMFVKKFKRKCDVRGCKNISDVFLISKRREMGNTIAICRDCMKEALSSTESYIEPTKVKKIQKPLFPHPELAVTLSSVAEKEPEPVEVIEEVAEETPMSVAEDSVTIEEKPLPKPKTTANNKKKAKKK
jgi:hypothetical protein